MISTETFPPFSRPSPTGSLGPHQQMMTTETEMTTALTATHDDSKLEHLTQPDNMSSFQSAKDRFDRLNNRPGTKGGGLNNATSGSWRRTTVGGGVSIGGRLDLSRQRSMSNTSVDETVPVSSVRPGPVWPMEEQLEVAYAYAIRREDGTYTRLIRADELGDFDFAKVPVSQGPEGLIALPAPKLPRPEHREGPEKLVSRKLVESLPMNRAVRPKIPAYPGGALVDSGVAARADPIEVQKTIDGIVAANAVSPIVTTPTKTPRRQKIYCDKWIHEGVCAFTQLGCKYKHEMPMDKATQLSLGLNHGLPAWYKRAHAVQIKSETLGSPPSSTQPRTAGPWRRSDGSSGHGTGFSIGSSMSSSPPGYSPFSQNNFGPIGPPPPPKYQQAPISNNPFSLLDHDDTLKMEDDDEEEITWSGRRC